MYPYHGYTARRMHNCPLIYSFIFTSVFHSEKKLVPFDELLRAEFFVPL